MTVWKEILIRVAEPELSHWDECCAKHNQTRSDFLRNAVRIFIANPDLANGIVKQPVNQVDIAPIMKAIEELNKKLEINEQNGPTFGNTVFKNSLAKRKVLEAVLLQKQKALESQETVTTLDQLKEMLKDSDPSLAPFINPPAGGGLSILDEVLQELNGKQELTWDFCQIIEFKEGYK
ncbi:MAG: hypothetical protein NWE92_01740 [Candidatus Bathyarchaeota archaeon]|nr:hypothetical protein [Candidatus Bathyarchaeota archaeon]